MPRPGSGKVLAGDFALIVFPNMTGQDELRCQCCRLPPFTMRFNSRRAPQRIPFLCSTVHKESRNMHVIKLTASIWIIHTLACSNISPTRNSVLIHHSRAKSGLEKFSLLTNWLFFCGYRFVLIKQRGHHVRHQHSRRTHFLLFVERIEQLDTELQELSELKKEALQRRRLRVLM